MYGKHAVTLHCDAKTFPMRSTHPVEEIWIALLEVEGVKHRGQGLTPTGAAINLAEKIAHHYDPLEEREPRPVPPMPGSLGPRIDPDAERPDDPAAYGMEDEEE